MNPTHPTTSDMRHIEDLFFRQMRRNTRLTTDPVLQARRASQNAKSDSQRQAEHLFLRSFDFQFSDQWTYV